MKRRSVWVCDDEETAKSLTPPTDRYVRRPLLSAPSFWDFRYSFLKRPTGDDLSLILVRTESQNFCPQSHVPRRRIMIDDISGDTCTHSIPTIQEKIHGVVYPGRIPLHLQTLGSPQIMFSRTPRLVFIVAVTMCISSFHPALGFGGLFSNRKARRAQKVAIQFQEILLNRRTIDQFEMTLPSHWEESLERAIHAATFAPNHKRTEPWRFHLLGKESIRKVCELNAQIVTEKKGEIAGEKKLKRWLAMPGWLVVTCQKKNGDSTTDCDMNDPMGLNREDYAACCCAIQNLCLSLHASGLGTKWTTGPVNFDSRFATAVGLNDSEEFVVGTIWFGTPTTQPSPPKKKLSLNDVLIRHS